MEIEEGTQFFPPQKDYPVGTKVRCPNGGHWLRVAEGWMWRWSWEDESKPPKGKYPLSATTKNGEG